MNMKQRIILKSGTLVQGGESKIMDVAVVEGKVALVGENIAIEADDKVIDCTGKIVCSGLVDLHVHLREPGLSAKETIATGTAAAAHGARSPPTVPASDPADRTSDPR